jgi:hypothetical protein
MLRASLVLLLCCITAIAAADSWLPPQQRTYLSPDGNVRVVVTPRTLQSAVAYFEDKVAEKEKAGQAPEANTQAMAEIQKRDGNDWRVIRRFPLVNDVGPVNVLVANGAHRIVTFDNWHSVGFGKDAVVIYDEQGKHIRSLGLKDFLPEAWVRHLPRTVSSIWWGHGHTLDPSGSVLTLQVASPAGRGPTDEETTVPLRISAEDGNVPAQESAAWRAALQQVDVLEARRRADWAMVRTARMQPLPVPQGSDEKAWRRYIVELRERLSDYDAGKGYCGITLLQEGGMFSDADSIGLQITEMADPGYGMEGRCVFAGPKTDKLAHTIADALEKNPPGSMQDDTIAVVGAPQDRARLDAAAKRAGATLEFIDATVPYPGKTEPEAVPEWFEAPTQ